MDDARVRTMDLSAFMGFLDGRPDGERWELSRGASLMMAPPKFGHQRIASNLERAINDALEASFPSRRAYREVGLRVSDDTRLEPEIAIVDEDIDPDTRHATSFYGVVEVVSSTDGRRFPGSDLSVIDEKVGHYKGHSDNAFVVVVEQDEARVTVHARSGDGWTETVLDDLDTSLSLPGVGPVCTLRSLYAGAKPTREAAASSEAKP